MKKQGHITNGNCLLSHVQHGPWEVNTGRPGGRVFAAAWTIGNSSTHKSGRMDGRKKDGYRTYPGGREDRTC